MIARIPAFPGLPQPRANASRLTTPVVLGVSVALHLALFGYLAVQRFTAPAAEEDAQATPETTITLWNPPKAEAQTTKPPPIHTPVISDRAPPVTTPIKADPQTHTITPAGPIETLTTSGTLTTAPPDPDPVITSPSWIRKPGAKEFARFYPDRALRMEKAGSAVLACRVTGAGAVVGCQVASETPTSYGFGEAALKLAPYFQLSPPTRDGRPIEGAGIQIPIRFSLGG
ncbi:MAG: energy transducer TonB [Alphaproteobacteria bacterium PA2]|nr:MAG: energy transducer TonB [Alphaproteobacteria bacterium PA2]